MSKRLIPIRDLSPKEEPKETNEEVVLEQEKEKIASKKEEAESLLVKRKEEAEALIRQAREEIEAEKEAWEEEKRIIAEQARMEGRQEGFMEGQKEGKDEYASLIDQANTTISDAEHLYKEKVESAEEEILHIAMRAGRRILGKSLEGDPSQFRSLVKEAIKEVADQPTISIYVHPHFHEELTKYREELSRMMDSQAQLSVYAKNFEDPYQCYIESPFGRVDASIDSQFTLIREAIMNVMKEGE
ncbi:flagellar assembly protein FliH [Salimicrobium halophilum]|uniref:Flagellar assembly protein FliH n=1 Tax=Salimicrobium halophilum TaxID=86666 RepID=A0A1G8QBG5_9BACI|nr:flagellar assembly protein FliH [Salimicrobium halophilum]SDJ01903.1 flagellar assembly protein FliH [Salimicrobium halophilum]